MCFETTLGLKREAVWGEPDLYPVYQRSFSGLGRTNTKECLSVESADLPQPSGLFRAGLPCAQMSARRASGSLTCPHLGRHVLLFYGRTLMTLHAVTMVCFHAMMSPNNKADKCLSSIIPFFSPPEKKNRWLLIL